MDIKELKTKIIDNTLNDNVLIFKYSDNKFLSYHYVEHICKNKNKEKLYINSLNEIGQDDLFEEENRYLYILDVEKLTETVDPSLKNVIIITKELPNNLLVDYIDMTKILNWHVEDFIKMRLPGLDINEIRWLCEMCQYDIFRLNKECEKLEIFSEAMQPIIFYEINNENGYIDLNHYNIFSFTNALIKKDYKTLNDVLTNLQNIDIEAMGVVTIMVKQIKNIIDIQLNPKNTAETLGMNPKQYNAIKYNVGKFTNNQLIDMFEFLTGIDSRLKKGELSLDETNDISYRNKKLIDYICVNLLTIASR